MNTTSQIAKNYSVDSRTTFDIEDQPLFVPDFNLVIIMKYFHDEHYITDCKNLLSGFQDYIWRWESTYLPSSFSIAFSIAGTFFLNADHCSAVKLIPFAVGSSLPSFL